MIWERFILLVRYFPCGRVWNEPQLGVVRQAGLGASNSPFEMDPWKRSNVTACPMRDDSYVYA